MQATTPILFSTQMKCFLLCLGVSFANSREGARRRLAMLTLDTSRLPWPDTIR
jgi:hypothetical protein